MNDLVSANGEVISTEGNFCIFSLSDGRILYTETAKFEDKFVDFDAKKTMVIQVVPGKTKDEVGIASKKLSEFLLPMSKMRVPLSSIISIQDATNKNLVDSMRTALSGLVVKF